MSKTKTWLVLIAIIALGIFLRTYNINHVPPGIYPDEVMNGVDALTANQTGQYKLFYEANNGREGLFMNLVAMSFKFFGVSAFSLKLPSIIFGTLAIWGIYLLGAELFRSCRIGLISAFFVSVSFWAINFSRISFRANMLPAVLAFSFYFLFRGMRTRKWRDFAIGGLIFGLGLHTYISFRIAPLILLVMLVPLWLTRKNFWRNYILPVIIFIIFAVASAAPMLYDFFISHPEHWTSRTSEISILNPATNQGHLLQTFGKTLGLALTKYTFWGDQNWRHNFPPYAILDPLTGSAFLFGLIYAIIKFFHLLYLRLKRKIRDEKLEVFAFLLVGFFAMLVPEVMGYEGNPHALRSIGTLPFVFIFAALTFNYFLGKEENGQLRAHKKIAAGIVFAMLLSIGIFNSVKYHLVWAKRPETAQAFEKNITDLAHYTETIPKNKEVFAVLGNMQRVTLRFFNFGRPLFYDLHPADINSLYPLHPDNFEIVFSDYYKNEIINSMKKRFPNLQLEEKDGFYILKTK